jgi:hypothetical protein
MRTTAKRSAFLAGSAGLVAGSALVPGLALAATDTSIVSTNRTDGAMHMSFITTNDGTQIYY